jgi:CBS domain-containing protein
LIPVKDVMQRKVISFREDTPVDEIASTLAEKRITGAPVLSDDGHVAGIVSEVDVFTKKGKTAADIMSEQVISITEDTPIDEAARLLAGQRIRRLPVMAKGKMVGLLSRSDVLDFFAHTHWTCTVCGNMERGLEQPESCPHCGNKEFHLDRAHPGH